MWTSTRTAATNLDISDDLAYLRDEYNLPPGVIHLDGNSVGPLQRPTPARLRTFVAHRWDPASPRPKADSDARSEAQLAADGLAGLIGADPAEITVAESTSMHLFKALLAAARLRPGRQVLLLGRECFATDRYLARSAADFTGATLRLLDQVEELPEVLDDQVAMVALSHTDLLSGGVRDTAAITADIRRAGALSLWDLSNSAGALRVNLHEWDTDFALGCGYKYLGGGSGAPAYAYVARRHQADLNRVLPSFVGLGSGDVLNPLASRSVCAPSTLSISGLRAGLSILDDVSTRALEAKTHGLVELFLHRLHEQCEGTGLEVVTPPAGQPRGSQVSLRHRHAQYLAQGLFSRGILADFVEPDLLRFSFAPSWLRYVDIWEAVDQLHQLLEEAARHCSW